MNLPRDAKPAAWGVAGGAVAAIAIGFIWGGWLTGGTSEARAVDRAKTAVVAALTPMCVDNFRQSPDAVANLASLRKADGWSRHTIIEKGGWATIGESKEPDLAVARACAATLVS
jgi:hypothetical protein